MEICSCLGEAKASVTASQIQPVLHSNLSFKSLLRNGPYFQNCCIFPLLRGVWWEFSQQLKLSLLCTPPSLLPGRDALPSTAIVRSSFRHFWQECKHGFLCLLVSGKKRCLNDQSRRLLAEIPIVLHSLSHNWVVLWSCTINWLSVVSVLSGINSFTAADSYEKETSRANCF